MSNNILNNEEQIVNFLHGTDPQKYIISVEGEYHRPYVTLIINDPILGKRTEDHKYEPFLWFKEDITKLLYDGKRLKIIEACQKYDVKITKLRISDNNGYIPKRMETGYKFMAKCKKSYNDLINFFKDGGIDIFSLEMSQYFVMFRPNEQFLIQTGKRLFKGFDDYDQLHRFQYDLETEGLDPNKDSIFLIGVRDNRGFEYVLDTIGDTPQEKRDSERTNIETFFNIIDSLNPDIIAGYNSESFDWDFLFKRCDRLNIKITNIAKTLSEKSKIKRKPATLKLGNETEAYTQTYMYGYNIVDTSHAVRRAAAINSDIKGWSLKYITKFSKIAKPNRVYVPGNKIYQIWDDKDTQYCFNDNNGDWYKLTDKNNLRDDYKIVNGKYIIERYICDDLWETEKIDNLYNQATFLISKLLPTTFMRSSTMGTAGQWKLIMAAWSYQNNLAIPSIQPKTDFTGGLSRLLQVGYAKNVVKFDFAALYPKTQLTNNIFPDLDISGVMKGLLKYIVDTRDKFKFLASDEKEYIDKLKKQLETTNGEVQIQQIKLDISEHGKLYSLYDKKQLPLKILANSWFGSYGAPYIFNWGDIDSAEETTCRGRQYLRFMVNYFMTKYNLVPLVGDTDGFNFAVPEDISTIKYTPKGNHWKTKHLANQELIGLDAILAEFNESHMKGWMGLDIDEVCDSTINFARKNYAKKIKGKVKLVGSSIKSKKIPVYIEEFINEGIKLLLDGDGKKFIDTYYDYVDKIYNYQIPLVKIASKAKVKSSISDYNKKGMMKNKAGNPMPRQAHMELAIANNLNVSLGDVLYYINTGKTKSEGDIKTYQKSKMSTKQQQLYVSKHGDIPKSDSFVKLNCVLIHPSIVDRDFESLKELELLSKDYNNSINNTEKERISNEITEITNTLFTHEYNVSRYLTAFNNKVKPLLVCFKPEIRDKILLEIVKITDKETKQKIEKLKDRVIFTKSECELTSGYPFKDTDQDSYLKFMTIEDKEISFWERVNMQPNFIDGDEWTKIKNDYYERLRIQKNNGVQSEKDRIESIIKKLEVDELDKIINTGKLPTEIINMLDIATDDTGMLISRKWNEPICHLYDIFKYQLIAQDRWNYYIKNDITQLKDKYTIWFDEMIKNELLLNKSIFTSDVLEQNDPDFINDLIFKIKNNKLKNQKIVNITDDTIVEDVLLEDDYDDTLAERPD